MDSVATFTGVDPEGRPVYWSIHPVDTAADLNNDGDITDTGENDNPSADAGDFSISADGVLSFKSPPNFESPIGGGTPDNGTNTYNVVVVSSDDVPGATTDGEDPKMSYHKVTVEVTDVDEDGSVSLSTLQPQAGIALNVNGTAALKDQDALPGPNHRRQVEVGAVLGHGRPLDPDFW